MTFCVQCVYRHESVGKLADSNTHVQVLGIRHRKCGHVCMYIVNVHKIACTL